MNDKENYNLQLNIANTIANLKESAWESASDITSEGSPPHKASVQELILEVKKKVM